MGNTLSDMRKNRAPAPQKKRAGGNVLSDYLAQAIDGYFKRQGRYANEGLALADQGAGELRNANPWGALNMPLGALSYLTSPVNALLPGSDEISEANLSPEAERFLTAGTAGMMAVMPGGPKGPKGLGRGMASLADDATDAERAMLKARMEAEAANAAKVDRMFEYYSNAGRDHVLAQEIKGNPYPMSQAANANQPNLGQAFARQIEDADATRGPRAPYTGRALPAGSLPGELEKAQQAALQARLEAEAAQAMNTPMRQYTPEEIARLKAQLAASKTPEDVAMATRKREIPPIEEFLPPEMNPRGPGTSGPPGILTNRPGRIRGR